MSSSFNKLSCKELRNRIKVFYKTGFNRFRTLPNRLDKKRRDELVEIMESIAPHYMGVKEDIEDSFEKSWMTYKEIRKYMMIMDKNDEHMKRKFGIDMETEGDTRVNIRWCYEDNNLYEEGDYKRRVVVCKNKQGLIHFARSFAIGSPFDEWFMEVEKREVEGEMWSCDWEKNTLIRNDEDVSDTSSTNPISPPRQSPTINVKPVLANVCVFNNGDIHIVNIENYEMSIKNGQLILVPKKIKV
jgi:hypothetical protein